MKKWGILAAVVLLLAAGGWYWGSPSLALKGIKDAAVSGDKQELAERVDFPAIRESLKSQMRAMMMAEMAKDDKSQMAGLGMMLASAMIDPMIDGIISPSGIKTLVKNGRFKDPREAAPADPQTDQEWIIARDGFDRFTVAPKPENGGAGPTMVFHRDGLSWRLVDIEMPEKNPDNSST